MTTTNALLDALRDMDDDDLRELAYGVGCTANELWDLVLRPMNELYDEVLDARHGDDERLMRLLRCVRGNYLDERDPYDYPAAREHLRKVGLLTVEHEGKPYTYGTGWLFEPIPANDLAWLRAVIERGTIGEEVGA